MSDLIRRYDALKAVDMWESDWPSIDSAIRALPTEPVQAQIDEITLRETLHDLITEQSEGEWDDKTISKDVEIFLTAILALIRKGD